MSALNFGMSFVLKGIPHPKISSKTMVDGLFQVDIPSKTFRFITKCAVVHSVSFVDLYDARGTPDNKYVLILLFNNNYPCELHAQNENEREIVARILQDVLRKSNIDIDEKLRNNSIQKQAWVKKKGKMMSTKRLLHLNTARRCIVVYKSEASGETLPSYHILLHHRVTIVPRKTKSIQVVGTYKNIVVSFQTKEIRNEWLGALQAAKEEKAVTAPDPYFTGPMFEPKVQYMAAAQPKRYPQPHMAIARAGPSAD